MNHFNVQPLYKILKYIHLCLYIFVIMPIKVFKSLKQFYFCIVPKHTHQSMKLKQNEVIKNNVSEDVHQYHGFLA